jgi:hypothetical protein
LAAIGWRPESGPAGCTRTLLDEVAESGRTAGSGSRRDGFARRLRVIARPALEAGCGVGLRRWPAASF